MMPESKRKLAENMVGGFDAWTTDQFWWWSTKPDVCIESWYEDYDDDLDVDVVVNDHGEVFHIPMWSTMWHVDDSWIAARIMESPRQVVELGFDVYVDDERDDVWLGIDGAGYSFYDEHWIPLHEWLFAKDEKEEGR